MSEAKPIATLSGHLLARKGAARPAMRPSVQPLSRHENLLSAATADDDELEDLGWNDMGDSEGERHAAEILPLTPSPFTPESKAEAKAGDLAAAAQLAENARKLAAAEPLGKPGDDHKPEVVQQREAIAERLASNEADNAGETVQPEEAATSAIEQVAEPSAPELAADEQSEPDTDARPGRASSRRAAFTLRLDRDRHLKLRLACTIRNRSAQQVVTEALDRLLETMPELESLAAQVKRR